jgi:PAS domain S-box-containing protein
VFSASFFLRGSRALHPKQARPNTPDAHAPELEHGTALASSLLNKDNTLVRDEINLRSYMEAALGGILAVNSGGSIVFMNGHTEQMFGYERSEIVGGSLTILIPERFHEKYAAAFRAYFEAPSVRLLDMNMDLVALRKSGEEFPVEIGLSFVQGEEGTIALGFITDVTERMHTRDELSRVNAELVRSNKELENFAQLASHDLQEPLRVITSYLALLNRRYRKELNPEAGEFLDVVTGGASRMKHQIENLLNFSRIGTTASAFQHVQAGSILRRAVDNLEVTIKEQSAEITWDPLPEIFADSSLLVQVFQNLIANGIKFQKDGIPKVHISATGQNSEWVFAVRDNGIGIEARHCERIFQMFEHLHSSSEYQGYGMGLAISQKIVARHKGRIWLESKLGEGSTFFFTIPQ